MKQTTCQNLRDQLEEIIALKKDFDAEIKKASELKDLQALTTLKNKLEDKLVNLKKELFQNLEIVQKLETQYHESIALGASHNFYDKENPVITAVDGQNYNAPTWDQILKTLTIAQLENIKKLNNPTLIVVPFGLPFKKILEEIIKIANQQNIDASDFKILLNFPRSENFEDNKFTSQYKYFNNLKDKGVTKREVLQMKGGLNQFPGWQVIVMDGSDEVNPETLNQAPNELIKELQAKGLEVPNVEEWFFHSLNPSIKNQYNFRSRNFTEWLNFSDSNKSVFATHLSEFKFDSKPVSFKDPQLGCKILVRIN